MSNNLVKDLRVPITLVRDTFFIEGKVFQQLELPTVTHSYKMNCLSLEDREFHRKICNTNIDYLKLKSIFCDEKTFEPFV